MLCLLINGHGVIFSLVLPFPKALEVTLDVFDENASPVTQICYRRPGPRGTAKS